MLIADFGRAYLPRDGLTPLAAYDVPGQRVTMRKSEPFGGPLTVDVEGSEHAISRELAERIGVS